MPSVCRYCGAELSGALDFCASCGQPLPASNTELATSAARPEVRVDPSVLAPRSPADESVAEKTVTPAVESQPAVTAMRYAGFWRRFAAYFVDSILLFGVAVFLAAFFLLIRVLSTGQTLQPDPASLEQQLQTIALPLEIAHALLVWLYFALMESSSRQATLGKLLIGLVVTDLAGQRISFWRATGRHLGKFIALNFLTSFLWLSSYARQPWQYALMALLVLLGLLALVLAGLTEKKQALHDLLADTLVLRRR
jgi:uncharacterized RDD family membrane protein YckC